MSSEWKEVKLGEVADVLSGYAFKTKDFIDEGIPVIKIKNIIPPIVDISGAQYISRELFNEKKRYALEYNDILISLTGSNVNQINSAVGKIGRVRIKNEDMILNQRVGKLVLIDNDKCDYEYLYYYLIQDNVRYDLAASAGGSANQANISSSQIKAMKIILPPIDEQKAIANILSSLDDKIELNNQINKTLEQMAQTIFKHWFVDFEFPNEDGESYKSSGGEMVESELGMIPKGWEVKVLKDIASMKNGVNYSREQEGEKIKVVNVRDFDGSLIIDKFKLDYIHLPLKQIEDYRLEKYDCVVVRSAKPGETLLAIDNSKIVYSGFTIRVRTHDEFYKLFMFYCVRNSIQTLNNSSNGTVFKNLNQQILGSLKIVIPETPVLNTYNAIAESLLNLMIKNTEETTKLSNLRDTLLPKLMSGEIRVPLKEGDMS